MPTLLGQLLRREINPEAFYTWLVVGLLSVLTLVHFFVPFNVWFFAVVLVLSAWAIFYYPGAGLAALVITTMIWERWFTLSPLVVGVGTYKIYPLDFILLLTLAAAVWHSFKQPFLALTKLDQAVLWWVSLVTGGAIISWFVGRPVEAVFSAWKNYAFYSLVYWLIIWLWRKPAEHRRFTKFVVMTGAGLLVFVLYGLLVGRGLWSEYTPLSTFGARLVAATHAFYLTLAGLLLFVGYLFNKYLLSPEVSVLVLLGQGLGLAVSLFRNLWLGLLAGLATVFVLGTRLARQRLVRLAGYFLFGLVVFVLVVLVLRDAYPDSRVWESRTFYAVTSRLATFSRPVVVDESGAWRLAVWLGAAKQWLASPLWGQGLGVGVRFQFNDLDQTIVATALHNDWLGFLLQLGLIGLLSVGRIVWLAIRCVVAGGRELLAKRPGDFPLLLSWGGVLLLFTVAAFFGTYFDINLLVIFFWVTVGMIRAIRYA